MEHGVVLCGANSYEQKYYFNEEDFGSLPESIKKELHIMCVLYTEDVGGVLTMEFDGEGNLQFTVEADASDYLFDEIGSLKDQAVPAGKERAAGVPGALLPRILFGRGA